MKGSLFFVLGMVFILFIVGACFSFAGTIIEAHTVERVLALWAFIFLGIPFFLGWMSGWLSGRRV